MAKQSVVYTHYGIQLSNKQRENYWYIEQLRQILREVYQLGKKKVKPKRLDTAQLHIYNFFKNYKTV